MADAHCLLCGQGGKRASCRREVLPGSLERPSPPPLEERERKKVAHEQVTEMG